MDASEIYSKKTSSHFGSSVSSHSFKSRICSGFCCCCLVHCITISDAQQSPVAARRGSSRVDRARGSATSSVAPRFARWPSTVSSMATCASPAAIASAWAHHSERGSEEHSEIPDHEDSRTASFRGCIREADQGQRPCDEDQVCTSSFGRHRRSRSRWFASSVEARRVGHEGDAHPHTTHRSTTMVSGKPW